MANMPQRPRQHELGEEAVDALKSVLGPRLAFYARPQPEYGIDGDIEEFDHDRRATGIHFFVQVKGTDERDLRTALAYPIAMATANYYRAVSMPVLMVRYHAPTSGVYVRWFHQYDPYYGRGGEQSVTFRWQPEDLWDETTAVRVAAEARAYYAVRGAGMRLPQPLFIRADEEADVDDAELRIAFRKIASEAVGVLSVGSGAPEPGAAWVELQPKALVAHVAGAATATMHFPDGFVVDGLDTEQIAREGMVLLALAFERHGQDRAACELASRYLEGSSLISQPDVVFALTQSMARSGRVSDALALSERIDDPDDEPASVAAFILSLAPVVAGGSVREDDAAQYEQLLKQRIKLRKATHPREAAGAARNLGMFLRHQRRHDKAVEHFRRAAKFDPTIEQDATYWTALAGSLWMIRSYRSAAEAYAKAIELAPDDGFLVALHADALLYSGEYARASAEFKRFVDAGAPGDDGEYQIKAFVVPYLVQRVGVERQQRKTHQALKAFGDVDPVDDAGWAAASLAQLSYDALWGSAWLNLAVTERAAGNEEEAMLCDVLSTFLIPDDTETWVHAIDAAMAANESDLGVALLVVGQRIAGPPLTEHLVEQSQALEGEAKRAYLELIDRTHAQDEARRATTLVEEFVSEDGSFVLPVGFYRHNLGEDADDGA